jgi:hypothetical protein
MYFQKIDAAVEKKIIEKFSTSFKKRKWGGYYSLHRYGAKIKGEKLQGAHTKGPALEMSHSKNVPLPKVPSLNVPRHLTFHSTERPTLKTSHL